MVHTFRRIKHGTGMAYKHSFRSKHVDEVGELKMYIRFETFSLGDIELCTVLHSGRINYLLAVFTGFPLD